MKIMDIPDSYLSYFLSDLHQIFTVLLFFFSLSILTFKT